MAEEKQKEVWPKRVALLPQWKLELVGLEKFGKARKHTITSTAPDENGRTVFIEYEVNNNSEVVVWMHTYLDSPKDKESMRKLDEEFAKIKRDSNRKQILSEIHARDFYVY